MIERTVQRPRYLSKTTIRRCRRYGQVTPFIILAVATLALLGWSADLAFAKSFVPGLTAMNPLTAISFVAASIALLSKKSQGAGQSFTHLVTSCALIAVGMWRTVQYVTPISAPIDRVMASSDGAAMGLANEMAETTAISFVFLGASLLFLRGKSYRYVIFGQITAAIVTGMGLLTLVSYAYDVSTVTRPVNHIPMAMNTGLLFLLAGFAVIASRPDAGFMIEFASQHFPGVVARRLLVGAVFLPILIGWLRLVGEKLHLYSLETGVALVAVFTTVAIVALIWWAAKSLEDTDSARRSAESQVRTLSDQLRARNEELEVRVADRTRSLQQSQEEILERLARAAAYKDEETGSHVKRMSEYSYVIAKAIGLAAGHCDLLRAASPLHDLGKIGIPDAILRKPGKLSAEEFQVIKTHPGIGADLLSGGAADVVRMAELIALSHHERWDGTGYPGGLKRTDIPLEGRIVAIADVLDALTSERPYKRAWSFEEAIEEIQRQSAKQFDPEIVEAFLAVQHELGAIYSTHQH